MATLTSLGWFPVYEPLKDHQIDQVKSPDIQGIVIVDDEKSFADMLGNLLREHLTAPVHTFTHPEQALDQIIALRPGVVVTDYYMPTMTGIEFIRTLHGLSPQTPCIIITGHPFSIDDHTEDCSRNLKAVLPKPFRWQQLAELMKHHWAGDTPLSRRANASSL